MALVFRRVTAAPLIEFDAVAPDGFVIGIAGENGSGKNKLLRLAAGLDQPESGTVEASGTVRMLGPLDALTLSPTPILLMEHTFARHDPLVRDRAALAIDRLRRNGSTILLVSHEEDLLLHLADEVWWLREGRLAGRGDAREVLAGYKTYLAERFRDWGRSVQAPMAPRVRRGDGRAEVLRIDLVGEDGRATMVWRSGELATIKVTVRYHEAVEDPVVGIMIRTIVGLNVYGTNTELEKLKLGPCAAGDTIEINFGFRCELCPQEYTLTVASHDPNGVWHDWLDDAVPFTVTDNRYSAGVANLRANVSFQKTTTSRPE
jgi:ABC-type thiamine transport system ATPase subunit